MQQIVRQWVEQGACVCAYMCVCVCLFGAAGCRLRVLQTKRNINIIFMCHARSVTAARLPFLPIPLLPLLFAPSLTFPPAIFYAPPTLPCKRNVATFTRKTKRKKKVKFPFCSFPSHQLRGGKCCRVRWLCHNDYRCAHPHTHTQRHTSPGDCTSACHILFNFHAPFLHPKYSLHKLTILVLYYFYILSLALSLPPSLSPTLPPFPN